MISKAVRQITSPCLGNFLCPVMRLWSTKHLLHQWVIVCQIHRRIPQSRVAFLYIPDVLTCCSLPFDSLSCIIFCLTAGAGTSKKRRAPVRKRHEHEGTVPLGVKLRQNLVLQHLPCYTLNVFCFLSFPLLRLVPHFSSYKCMIIKKMLQYCNEFLQLIPKDIFWKTK